MGNVSYKLKRPKSFAEISTVHRLSWKRPHHDGPFSKFLRRFRHETVASKERVDGQLLSDYETKLVRSSWDNITPNRDLFGCNVYEWIFEEEPCLKFLFLWDDMSTEELHRNTDFQKQAKAIMETINQLVNNIENFETETKLYLYNLGKRHTRFRGFGFTPKHWELFRESILMRLNETLPENFKDRAVLMEAWRVLIQCAIDTMKAGYDNSVQKQHIFMKDAYSVRLNLEQQTQNALRNEITKVRHSGPELPCTAAPVLQEIKRWSTGKSRKPEGYAARARCNKQLSSSEESVSPEKSTASLERVLRIL